MNSKVIILVLTVSSLLFGMSATVFAAGAASDPLSTESTSSSSSSTSKIDYLGSSRQSIGASTTHQTISASSKGIVRASDFHESLGWGNGDSFLPGGDGWVDGQPGNVGYPIGDASGAMLLLMVVIYFVYRGVSSTKRRNNI